MEIFDKQCIFGYQCANKNCTFSHDVKFNQTSEGRKLHCRFGWECMSLDCPFYHPDGTLKSSKTSNFSSTDHLSTKDISKHQRKNESQVQALSKAFMDAFYIGPLQQQTGPQVIKNLCRYNLNCKRSECYYNHDTANRKSPASQMNNFSQQKSTQYQTSRAHGYKQNQSNQYDMQRQHYQFQEYIESESLSMDQNLCGQKINNPETPQYFKNQQEHETKPQSIWNKQFPQQTEETYSIQQTHKKKKMHQTNETKHLKQ